MFNKMPTAVEVGADRPIIVRLDTHNIRHGETHQQSLHQPLYHDPERFVVAIEVTYHAEQDGSGDGLGRKALEVGVAVGNNSGICRKQTGENVTLAPHQCKYDAAEHQTDANAGEHGLLGAFFIASTHVLGHKGCHGLHQRTGDQHGKINDLARHTVAGRCLQPQPVDESAERQKGKLGQKLLQSQRQTDAQKFFALGASA